MEEFFSPEPLRYWVREAAITNIVTTNLWPPSICVTGYASCVRGWHPTNEKTMQFEPITALLEVDGCRAAFSVIEDGLLITADASRRGLVTVWGVQEWNRLQSFYADGEILSLDAGLNYIAVGMASGRVKVWKRASSSADYTQAYDFQVDSLPIHTLHLAPTPEGSKVPASAVMLLAHARSTNQLCLWRLDQGTVVYRMAQGSGEEAKADPSLRTVVLSACVSSLFVMLLWQPPKDPVISLVELSTGKASTMDSSHCGERLAGRAVPLALDFDGTVIAVGYSDGAVVTYGRVGWMRWHKGAVGALKLMRHRQQLISGGADKQLKLWTYSGVLLAQVDLGFQVTALAIGDIFAAAGGSKGDLQLLALADVEQDAAAGTAAGKELTAQPRKVQQYDYYFDTTSKQLTVPPTFGPIDSHPSAFKAWLAGSWQLGGRHWEGTLPPRGAAPPGQSVQQQHTAASKVSAGSQDAGTKTQVAGSNADAGQTLESRRSAMRAMGEGTGVARAGPAVSLESDVSRLGRRCDNPACLVRSGVTGAKFMRCGGCKTTFYCSAHCQRTHWRDGHSKECAKLAAAATAAAAAPAAVTATGDPSAEDNNPRLPDEHKEPANSAVQREAAEVLYENTAGSGEDRSKVESGIMAQTSALEVAFESHESALVSGDVGIAPLRSQPEVADLRSVEAESVDSHKQGGRESAAASNFDEQRTIAAGIESCELAPRIISNPAQADRIPNEGVSSVHNAVRLEGLHTNTGEDPVAELYDLD